MFGDPDTNQFVSPEGGKGVFGPVAQFEALQQETAFHKAAKAIDRGITPYNDQTGPSFVKNASAFLNGMKSLQLGHRDYNYKRMFAHGKMTHMDTAGDMISFSGVMAKSGRHCINGKWETKEQWLEGLIESYHALTVWHEFGHVIGLRHNFMGSVDRPNFPIYKDKQGKDHIGMFQSTVMEYNAAPDRVFWANEER